MNYKLGKLPAKHDPQDRTLKAIRYLTGLPQPKQGGVDWGAAVRQLGVPLGMLGNDQYGDCFWAMIAHAFITWNANVGRKVTFSTDAVLDCYCSYLGIKRADLNDQTDQGTVMLEGLKWMRTNGMTDDAGKVHKIGAFMRVDPKDQAQVQVCLDLFGALLVGVVFLNDWENATIWAPDKSGAAGGHAINGIARDLTHGVVPGVNIDTWGEDGRWIPWTSFQAGLVDELFVTVAEDWLDDKQLAPSGLNMDALTKDLALVTA